MLPSGHSGCWARAGPPSADQEPRILVVSPQRKGLPGCPSQPHLRLLPVELPAAPPFPGSGMRYSQAPGALRVFSRQRASFCLVPQPPPQKRPRSASRKFGLPARLQGSSLGSPSGTSLHAQTWSSLSAQPQETDERSQGPSLDSAAAVQAPAPALPRVS